MRWSTTIMPDLCAFPMLLGVLHRADPWFTHRKAWSGLRMVHAVPFTSKPYFLQNQVLHVPWKIDTDLASRPSGLQLSSCSTLAINNPQQNIGVGIGWSSRSAWNWGPSPESPCPIPAETLSAGPGSSVIRLKSHQHARHLQASPRLCRSKKKCTPQATFRTQVQYSGTALLTTVLP